MKYRAVFLQENYCNSFLRIVLVLSWWLAFGNYAVAQIYSGSYATTTFKYFDLASHTWTVKSNEPEGLYDITPFQGKIYGISQTTSNFYMYDPDFNKWIKKAAATAGLINGHLVAAGNYIYANSTGLSQFSRYDPATNTWTQLAATPDLGRALRRHMVYDGGDYIYLGYSQGANVLARYSISGNTWTAMPNPPSGTSGVAIKNGILYFTNENTTTFISYNPATSTYTTLANAPRASWTIIGGDGNYLYSTPDLNVYGTNFIQRYDISTNTWTTYTGGGDYALAYAGCSITASLVAVQATCGTNGGVNANASLMLTSSGVTKVGYSIGSGYTGPDYASATAVTSASMTVASNLANPTTDQPYTVRVFQDAACYKDIVVTLKPQICLTSDISVSVSPLSQTAASGQMQTYTVTVTNAGPDASSVKLKVPIPVNRTFLNASPQQGTYTESTQIWDVGNLTIGSKTLTVNIKVN